MLSDLLLALGILLSTATQLRIEGNPVGLGELCLVGWVGIKLYNELWKPSYLSSAFYQLMFFWLLFALAQSLGAIMSFAAELIRDPYSSRHDTAAYLLLACVSCCALLQADAGYRLRRTTWFLAALGSGSLFVLLAGALGPIELPVIEPWYYDRLIGWAENANMFALASAILLVLSIHLAETSTGPYEKIAALCCGIFPLFTGLLTRSDAFHLFLLISSAVYLILKIRTWLFSPQKSMVLPALACMIMIVLPLILASLVPFAPSIVARMESAAAETYDADGQGEHRFQLWSEGISRGLDSAMIGFGPGAHLVKSKYKRAPPPNFEAHNTVIDIFTQGGILAVLSLGWLGAITFRSTYRSRQDALTALLFGLAVFSMFHLIVRHPIFWFVMVACLATQCIVRKEERLGSRTAEVPA